MTLMSAVTLMKEAIPVMQARKFGRIINLTSVAVKQPILGRIFFPMPFGPAWWACPKPWPRFTRRTRIPINNVCPGYMLTERVRELSEAIARRQHATPEAVIKGWEAEIPMGRPGRPEELADLVVFWPRNGPVTSPGPRFKWTEDIIEG